MKRRALLAFLGLSLTACGRSAPSGKLEARRKFEAFEAGQQEIELQRALGPPFATVMHSHLGDRKDIVYSDERDHRNIKLDLGDAERKSWPPLARRLPTTAIEMKVMIYDSGGVTAYYHIGEFHKILAVNVVER